MKWRYLGGGAEIPQGASFAWMSPTCIAVRLLEDKKDGGAYYHYWEAVPARPAPEVELPPPSAGEKWVYRGKDMGLKFRSALAIWYDSEYHIWESVPLGEPFP